jgi:hypothetical protein
MKITIFFPVINYSLEKYTITVKMEVAGSSESSVPTPKFKGRGIREDHDLFTVVQI